MAIALALLLLVAGAAAMPPHKLPASQQTDAAIPQPAARGRAGASDDQHSSRVHPIDEALAGEFTSHHGLRALLPPDPPLAHRQARDRSRIDGQLEKIARVRPRCWPAHPYSHPTPIVTPVPH